METLVTLAPGFALTAEELAAAWNADPTCRAAAEALTEAPQDKQYDLGILSGPLLLLVGSAAGSFAADTAKDVLKDLLKQLIERVIKEHLPHGGARPSALADVVAQTRRDGSVVLVVTQAEEPKP